MFKLAVGSNFAVFVLFFGVAMIDAWTSRELARALLWVALGVVFLRADAIAARRNRSDH